MRAFILSKSQVFLKVSCETWTPVSAIAVYNQINPLCLRRKGPTIHNNQLNGNLLINCDSVTLSLLDAERSNVLISNFLSRRAQVTEIARWDKV